MPPPATGANRLTRAFVTPPRTAGPGEVEASENKARGFAPRPHEGLGPAKPENRVRNGDASDCPNTAGQQPS